jgi:hypothetical protein
MDVLLNGLWFSVVLFFCFMGMKTMLEKAEEFFRLRRERRSMRNWQRLRKVMRP